MMAEARDSILEIDGAPFKGKPHGWIQWKGTDVCIDLHCACGQHIHFDGDFLYSWKCPQCKRHYVMGSHIPMYELTPEESSAWKGCVVDVEPEIEIDCLPLLEEGVVE